MPSSLIAEHYMGMPAAERRRWTAREVRALIAANPLHTPRYELVDGELLVTPSPPYPHQLALALLVSLLRDYLANRHLGVVAISPSDVELEAEFLSQPDLFVVPMDEHRRVLRDGLPIQHLVLTVEVLSPTSARHDRVRKLPKYLAHVLEYWIVDLDARTFERWQQGEDRPEVLSEVLEWYPPGATEPFRLGLGPFFAEVFGEGGGT